MKTKSDGKNLKTIWRRDLSRLIITILEEALQKKDWSIIFDFDDPNEAVSYFLEKVTEALDDVVPIRAIIPTRQA